MRNSPKQTVDKGDITTYTDKSILSLFFCFFGAVSVEHFSETCPQHEWMGFGYLTGL